MSFTFPVWESTAVIMEEVLLYVKTKTNGPFGKPSSSPDLTVLNKIVLIPESR